MSPSAVPITCASFVAFISQYDASPQLAVGRVEEAGAAEERRKVDGIEPQVHPGGRDVGRGINGQSPLDPAIAEAHVQKPHDPSPILHPDTRRERLHRKVGGCDDAFGIQRHIHVHRAQPFDMQRHVGKQLAPRFKLYASLRLLHESFRLPGGSRARRKCRRSANARCCELSRAVEARRLAALVDGHLA